MRAYSHGVHTPTDLRPLLAVLFFAYSRLSPVTCSGSRTRPDEKRGAVKTPWKLEEIGEREECRSRDEEEGEREREETREGRRGWIEKKRGESVIRRTRKEQEEKRSRHIGRRTGLGREVEEEEEEEEELVLGVEGVEVIVW